MKCLVTGGTGFLGRHLVRQLVDADHDVRILVRQDALSLELSGAEVAQGDVLDPASLVPALEGVDVVFHLAGRVQHRGEATELYMLHVEGTRNMIAAAAAAEPRPRFVHMSTSGTLAVTSDGETIPDENAPYAIEAVRRWPYYLSKIYAEKVARDAHERGQLEVVILNPSLLLGPEDVTLGSSQAVLRFLRQEIPAVPPGGMNFVDVRDAAAATLAAAERGRSGERYLLGGPNMTLEAFFVLLGKVSGVPAPTIKASAAANAWTARAIEAVEGVGGFEGDESVAYAMAGHYWYLDARKAQRELGFRPRSPELTLRDSVRWIRSRGPIPKAEGTMGSLVRGVKRVLGRV